MGWRPIYVGWMPTCAGLALIPGRVARRVTRQVELAGLFTMRHIDRGHSRTDEKQAVGLSRIWLRRFGSVAIWRSGRVVMYDFEPRRVVEAVTADLGVGCRSISPVGPSPAS